MLTAALFIIAKTWKQNKCSSVDEWLNIHLLKVFNDATGGHPLPNTVLKNNEVLITNREYIILSMRSEKLKTLYRVIPTIDKYKIPRISKSIET